MHPFHFFPQMEGGGGIIWWPWTLLFICVCVCVCVQKWMLRWICRKKKKKKSDAVSESAISQWKRILFSLWFLMVDEWGKIHAFKKNQLAEEEEEKKKNPLFCVVSLCPRCPGTHTHTHTHRRKICKVKKTISPHDTWRSRQTFIYCRF